MDLSAKLRKGLPAPEQPHTLFNEPNMNVLA